MSPTSHQKPDTSHPTLISGTASQRFASLVARELGVELAPRRIDRFPDSEVSVRIDADLRDADVFVVQSTSPPVDENLVELMAIVDACRRSSARRITAVIPYFGYARGDRRTHEGTPVMASLTATLLQSAGIDRIVTVDVHTPQLEGFFKIPVVSLTVVPLLCDALRSMVDEDLVVVAPDAGRASMAGVYAGLLGAPAAFMHKKRESGTSTKVLNLVGDVRDRRCLIIDDMISTGGTIVESARVLLAAGARPGILVAATHGLLVGDAVDRMRASGVERIVVSDSVEDGGQRTENGGKEIVEYVSVAGLIARSGIARDAGLHT